VLLKPAAVYTSRATMFCLHFPQIRNTLLHTRN